MQTSSVTGELDVLASASSDDFSHSHDMELNWDDYRGGRLPLDALQETYPSPTSETSAATDTLSFFDLASSPDSALSAQASACSCLGSSPSHSPAVTSVHGAGGDQQSSFDGSIPATNAKLRTLPNMFCLKCRDRRSVKAVSFARLHSLVEHVLTKHLNMRMYCPVEGCGRKFSHATSLRRHISGRLALGKHRDLLESITEDLIRRSVSIGSPSGMPATLICPECGVKLTRSDFQRHVRKLHLGSQFGCPIQECRERFIHFAHLQEHMKGKHGNILKPFVGGRSIYL
ncbi:hypothetical protein BDZ89DRAFT_1120374 [Hymenopellis radicata]|nr:hypothetical protein BDZ89DRAFT_1120374 [Hymenopellis radicata]